MQPAWYDGTRRRLFPGTKHGAAPLSHGGIPPGLTLGPARNSAPYAPGSTVKTADPTPTRVVFGLRYGRPFGVTGRTPVSMTSRAMSYTFRLVFWLAMRSRSKAWSR